MAKLSMEDVADLMPLLLVVKLAGNPELDELQATEAICKVIDRHVEAAA
jgi:hypothetical protein